jgi:hypothetical protein
VSCFRHPVAPFALALLFVAGCGSVGGSDGGETAAETAAATTAPAVRGIVTNTVPKGPSDPAANLELALPKSNPEFQRLAVACPKVANPPNYPFECRFTGVDHRRQAGVAGTIAVYGVYKPTRTYVYETNYRPVKAR